MDFLKKSIRYQLLIALFISFQTKAEKAEVLIVTVENDSIYALTTVNNHKKNKVIISGYNGVLKFWVDGKKQKIPNNKIREITLIENQEKYKLVGIKKTMSTEDNDDLFKESIKTVQYFLAKEIHQGKTIVYQRFFEESYISALPDTNYTYSTIEEDLYTKGNDSKFVSFFNKRKKWKEWSKECPSFKNKYTEKKLSKIDEITMIKFHSENCN